MKKHCVLDQNSRRHIETYIICYLQEISSGTVKTCAAAKIRKQIQGQTVCIGRQSQQVKLLQIQLQIIFFYPADFSKK